MRAARGPAERRLIEASLAGPRFVRNQIGSARGRAYQAQLAGHAIGGTFRRTVTFLTLTCADAASTVVISATSDQVPGRS